jgi:hypothetical protein
MKNGGMYLLSKHILLCYVVFKFRPGVVQFHKNHFCYFLVVSSRLCDNTFELKATFLTKCKWRDKFYQPVCLDALPSKPYDTFS